MNTRQRAVYCGTKWCLQPVHRCSWSMHYGICEFIVFAAFVPILPTFLKIKRGRSLFLSFWLHKKSLFAIRDENMRCMYMKIYWVGVHGEVSMARIMHLNTPPSLLWVSYFLSIDRFSDYFTTLILKSMYEHSMANAHTGVRWATILQISTIPG